MAISLNTLRSALVVAEHLNFRHAAQAMRVSQSVVSARVKCLEEDLGILLFERHARGVRLTATGDHFIARVKAAISQLDYAVETAGMLARGKQGRLRVCLPALIPSGFLATLIARYRGTHPGVDVEIAEGTARESVMQLRANTLDLTFVAGIPELPDCRSRRIWRERLLAALPASSLLAHGASVAWADLASETFIVRLGGTGPQVYDHIVMRLARNAPNPSILRFDVDRITLLSMVAQGFGVTIAGEATTHLYVPGVTFLPILDEPEYLPFSAVWSPHNHSPALRSLLDLAGKMGRSGQTI